MGGRLVVVGLPELGAILAQGHAEAAFSEVANLAADDGPGGRLALAEAMQSWEADNLAFVFCDIVAPGLRTMAGGLAQAGHRVVLLTGTASPALDTVPTLHLEFSPNDVLDALSQLPGVGFLPPVEGLDDLFSDAPVAEAIPVAPEVDSGGTEVGQAYVVDDDGDEMVQEPEGWTDSGQPDDDGDLWSRPDAEGGPYDDPPVAGPGAGPDWDEGGGDTSAGPPNVDQVVQTEDEEPEAEGDWWSRPVAAEPARRSTAAVVDFDVAAPPSRSSRRTSPLPPASAKAAGRGGKAVIFTCPKGGTGKSSTSLALAAYLGSAMTKAGRSVVFVDANVQQADASRYLRRAHDHSIADLARMDPDAIDEAAVSRVLVADEQNHMTLLFGPPTVAESDPTVVTPELYARVVTLLRGMFDWVFVDTPVAEKHHRLFSEFVLPEADRLVVVVNPSHVTIENASRWLTAIADPVYAGGDAYPRAGVRILLNKAEEGIGADTTEVAALLEDYAFLGAIPESPAWRSAANNGELLSKDPCLGPVFAEVLHGITAESALLDGNAGRSGGRVGATNSSRARGGLGWLSAWAARQREKADAADAEKATKKKAGRRGR
ncbi:MAG: AAA family ATPase [Actinomycetota bacterium]|nr:AAA family ATPase [Actinomycetota bacterium]